MEKNSFFIVCYDAEILLSPVFGAAHTHTQVNRHFTTSLDLSSYGTQFHDFSNIFIALIGNRQFISQPLIH